MKTTIAELISPPRHENHPAAEAAIQAVAPDLLKQAGQAILTDPSTIVDTTDHGFSQGRCVEATAKAGDTYIVRVTVIVNAMVVREKGEPK